ncbi:hypothetical protein ACHAXS_006545 [Conticribra weissflogii]
MFVDGIAFEVTVSQKIKFITTHYLPIRTSNDLAESLKETIRLYQRGGFKVQTLLMDGEFEKVKTLLPEVIVNTTSAGEHVGEVERHIRTIKERTQGITNTLPFRTMPARMMVELIYFCTMWLNAIPNRNGVTQQFSPREIVVRQQVDYKKHCQVPFGAYCEVFEDRDQTNTMASCTRGAISLGPTGNMQGTYKFFCLTTGRVIKRQQFKELPMPGSIIRKLEQWDGDTNIGALTFADRRGNPYQWNKEYSDTRTDKEDDRGDNAEFPGVVVEDNINEALNEDEGDDVREQAARAAENANLDAEQPQITFGRRQVRPNEQALIQEILAGHNTGPDKDGIEGTADQVGDPEETTQDKPEPMEQHEPRRSTRQNRGRRITERYAAEFQGNGPEGTAILTLGEEDQEVAALTEEETNEHIMGVIMTQYAWRAGLKRFRKKGKDAMSDELGKLHNMQTFIPVHRNQLTEEEEQKAVESLMFLKEKRDQTI